MERQYGYILFVLTAVCSLDLVCGQSSSCILNRLDVLPCQPRPDSSLPEQNEYAVYRTRIRTDPLRCRYRNPDGNQIISAISTLGTDELRLIHSPGFVGGTSYSNRLVVMYNISCGPGRLAFYTITSLDLHPQRCNDGRCVDYVEVDRGEFGVTESSACSDDMADNQLQIERRDFTIRFRSSDGGRGHGFQAYVICYDPMEANAENCTEVGSDKRRRSVSWEEMEQGAQTAVASHREWHHQRYNRGIHNASDEIVIQFGEEVQYRRQIIRIRTNEGRQRRIYNVTELNVLEGSGEVKVFFGDAFSQTLCQCILKFSGPARLFIAAERAWLERFAFNPMGVVPTPEEAEVITRSTQELFAMLDPEADDVIFDSAGSGSGSGSGGPPTNSTGNDRRKRGTMDMISDDAILDALENENACNAAVRTVARGTLVVACYQDPDRVYQLSGNQTLCG